MSGRAGQRAAPAGVPGVGAQPIFASAPIEERLAELFERFAREIRDLARSPEKALADLGSGEAHGRSATPKQAVVAVTMKPSLLTPSDVAELLQLDVRTVRRMRLRGELPEGIQVGKSVRWRPEEIQRWLKERGS